MKTSVLIVLIFSVLTVTLAAKPKKNATTGGRDVEKSAPKDTEKKDPSTDQEGSESESPEIEESPAKDKAATKSNKGKKTKPADSGSQENEDASPSSKPKKESKPASTKKSPKKPVKEDEDADDIKIDDDKSASKKKSPKKTAKKNKDDEEIKIDEEKSASKNKSPKKPVKKVEIEDEDEEEEEEEDDDEEIGIDEDLDEILNDDEEEEEEVEIPRLDKLSTTSDPIELAEKINNIADEKKRNDLITELRNLWKANKKSLPGKFYGAAVVALADADQASEFWEKHLEIAKNKAKNAGKSFMDKTRNKTRKGLGNAMENGRKIIEADPIGLQLARGDSVLLTTLSDASKNVGKFTDSAYDAALNASGIVRALTPGVDMLPFGSIFKNNVHNTIEDQLRRGRYIWGSIADNTSKALADAADDAEQTANRKQNLLSRQFSSKRTLR